MTRFAVILVLAFTAMSASGATRAPWIAQLAALERGHQPGIEELPRLAAALADAPDEVLIAWDRQGRFLFHVVGDSHDVWVSRNLIRKLKDSVAIHNHPRGLLPSPRDLDTVLCYGPRRLYVAARIDGVISLTDISRGEAMQRLRLGGLPDRQPTWRPVVETASPLEIEGRDVRAAQIAYNLLGAWLWTRGPEMFRPLASGPLVALLVLTALGLALAALLAALHRARLERAVEVERVRTRIAADLHDELGAGLSRISLLAEVARRESAGRRAAEPMAQVGEAARRLVGQARDIVWSLNPRFDDLESFLGRVREVAGELLEPAGIAWRLEAPDARAASTIRLRPELRRRLLLLLKESLHNVVCHAGASRVELSIRLAGRRLTGSIADDGRGFDPTSPPRASASGLASMRERLEELGGELEIDAAPGRGTRISFAVPL